MARQVLPIAGAVIGGFLGGPTGAQIGFTIGSIVGNAVDPQTINGPKIGESALQTSAEGVFRPIIFGTGAVKGNVISRGNRQVKTQRTQQGKGGGPVVEEQRVYWTFDIRICEGPISGVTRIWQDEKLVYDIRPGSPILAESAEYANRFRLYLGEEDQLPDPDVEAYQGIGNVNAYRGTAHIVFPNFDLTDRRESIPDFRFEVASVGASPPVQTGSWIFGPVARDGIDGGPENYYRLTEDIADWYSGVQYATPGWVTSISRISSANGAVFLHSNTEDGAVSFDNGGTWSQCDTQLPLYNVYWNGDFYYCRDIRSPDGIAWDTIPNLPSLPRETIARSSDGAVICSYTAGGDRFEISHDNGLNWTTSTYNALIDYMATDGSDVHFTASAVDGRYTDDNFLTVKAATSADGTALYTPYFGGGVWHRKGFNGRFWKSIDGGDSYQISLNFQTLGANTDNTVAYSDEFGQWAVSDFTSGTPFEWQIRYSGNGGASWFDGDILYGAGANLVFIGVGDGSSGQPGQPVSLASIVSALHDRIGGTPYDVSELDDMVLGLVLSGDYTAADAIRTLMPIYAFDASEYDSGSGYRIHYPKRGKPVVTTLTVDNLIAAPERTLREDSLERPKKLHLHYENPTIGYAPAKASILRNSQDIKVVGERSIQVPVSFSDVNEPAQIADRLMRQTWVEVGGEEEFVIPDNLLGLVPSDCIGVSLRGQTRRMRIVSQEIGPGRIRMRMLPDRQSAYTSNISGVPVPNPTPPLPSIVGPTAYEFMDIPALNDNNDRLLWYDAASGMTPAWYGAQTQHKAVSEVEFSNSARFTQNTIMGTITADVPEASEHYTDTTNTVQVQLFTDDVLDSLTNAQFLSEGGSFALEKDDGSWEILQYRDSVDEGDGAFTLSHLARGRLNSGSSDHTAGAAFVLLDAVQSVDAVTAWLNNPMTTRAVSFGNSPDGATQYVNTYVGKSQIEFPVAHLFLERDVDTINASTVPRHRFGTEDNPIRSINWTGYRWMATDGANSITVDTLSDSTSFDVTGWSSPVTVTISQLNRFTGPGPAVSEDIA